MKPEAASTPGTSAAAFSLLELLMAMAVFAIAAVSLAGALNLISLAVVESAERSELREELRALLLETARDGGLEPGVREIRPDGREILFRVEATPLTFPKADGGTVTGLFEVTVEAHSETPQGGRAFLDSASTATWPALF